MATSEENTEGISGTTDTHDLQNSPDTHKAQSGPDTHKVPPGAQGGEGIPDEQEVELPMEGVTEFMNEVSDVSETLEPEPVAMPISLLSVLLGVPYGTLRGFIERDEVETDPDADQVSIVIDKSFEGALNNYNPRSETLVDHESFDYHIFLQAIILEQADLKELPVPSLSTKMVSGAYGVEEDRLLRGIKRLEAKANPDSKPEDDSFTPFYLEVYEGSEEDISGDLSDTEPAGIRIIVKEEPFEALHQLMDEEVSEEFEDNLHETSDPEGNNVEDRPEPSEPKAASGGRDTLDRMEEEVAGDDVVGESRTKEDAPTFNKGLSFSKNEPSYVKKVAVRTMLIGEGLLIASVVAFAFRGSFMTAFSLAVLAGIMILAHKKLS